MLTLYKLRYFAVGLVVVSVVVLYHLHAIRGPVWHGRARELLILDHKSVTEFRTDHTDSATSHSYKESNGTVDAGERKPTETANLRTKTKLSWSDHYHVIERTKTTDAIYSPAARLSTAATVLSTDRKHSLVNRTLIMLFWSNFYSQSRWKSETEEVECDSPEFKCLFTSDHHLFSKSDAVVFHGRGVGLELSVKQALLQHRPPQQRWVLENFESPFHTPGLFFLNGLINWTATYMTDSDVVGGRFAIPGVFQGGFDANRNYLENKTGMAAILVSNCIQERFNWVRELQKYIQVDVYGGCGTSCGKEENCYVQLRKYKFYLSFENSYCMDYITEKLCLHAIGNGIVPVTISWVNMNTTYLSAPPGSFINALHFPSVKALADYMTKVGNTPELYNRYFRWRSNYTIYDFQIECGICKRLHLDRESVRSYPKISSWYSTQQRCRPYPKPP